MTTIVEYTDRDMLAIDVASVLAGEIENALLTHERASFAVPGGATPGPIFDVLCAADLDWSRVNITLTDERWVGEDSTRSNGALLRRRLLINRAQKAWFKSLYVAGASISDGAAQMCDELVGDMPLSVLLLGMGADMHTASLFPGAQGLADALASDAPLVVPIHAEGQEARVSLSARVLDGALSKHLVIYGADKRAAFEASARLSPRQAPIAAVSGLTVHWAE